MLARDRRMPGFRVKQLLGAGTAKQSPFLIVKSGFNKLNHPRFAVVVGKKVSVKATVRNRLKRQVMDAIAKNMKTFKPGIDYALILRPNFEPKHFYEIFAIKTN